MNILVGYFILLACALSLAAGLFLGLSYIKLI
nr:cytochrome b6/f complex subunit VI [Cryptomonas sp. NIES-345]BDA98395.1 cytochrome b6/f complex subunit VI [Cryptomonas sp. NIES-1327]